MTTLEWNSRVFSLVLKLRMFPSKRDWAEHVPTYRKQLVQSRAVIYKTSNNSLCEYWQCSRLHKMWGGSYILPVWQTAYRSHIPGTWPLKMGPTGCPKTLVTNCHSALRKIPEEGRSHLHFSSCLKSCYRMNSTLGTSSLVIAARINTGK
jgi:hypothetical protein